MSGFLKNMNVLRDVRWAGAVQKKKMSSAGG